MSSKKYDKPVLVTRAYLPPREEYDRMLDRIWESHWLTNMGEMHEELKEKLRGYLGIEGLELFTNGHLALEMILQAMSEKYSWLTGRRSGGHRPEIITTPFSFASTTHAIVREGMKPVFCDVKKSDCTMDPEKIEALITEDTVAILPVHVYGQICDYKAIETIAKKHGLQVIYDAAHAFGEKVNGRGVMDLGDASMMSFHATKVFNTIEGGAVSYHGEDIGRLLYQLKNFGIMDAEHVEFVGGNAKMSEFQAAMGLVNLTHVDEQIEKRRYLCGLYADRLGDREEEGIRLLCAAPEVEYNYSYMPVFFNGPYDRDKAADALKARGILARKYFYPAINAFDCYKDEYDPGATPAAAELSRQVLTLPLYPELEPEVVEEICSIILNSGRS